MTSFNYKSSGFIAFLCLALLFNYTNGAELGITKEVFCGKLSGTFKGPCFIYDPCIKKCKEEEGADDGVCNVLKCWCKYKCGNVCERPSGIWKGPCFNFDQCDKQCREKENAAFGYCDGLFKCICSSNC